MDSAASPSLPPLPVEGNTPPFFNVGLLKLAVLSITTLGLYECYWLYKNWFLIHARTQKPISPFWRAVFGLFWIYALLKEVRDYPAEAGISIESKPLQAGLLAFFWIVITLFYKLPGAWWFFCLFSFIPLLIAQQQINRINFAVAPQAPANARFTWANWIWIVIGGITLVLAVIGSFMPDQS